jgi:hypothetical protein
VSSISDSEIAAFGVFATVCTPALQALVQIRSIANRVLNHASIHGFEAVRPRELLDGLPDGAAVSRPQQGRSTLNDYARCSDSHGRIECTLRCRAEVSGGVAR